MKLASPVARLAVLVIGLMNASFVGIVVGLLAGVPAGIVASLLTLVAEALIVQRLGAAIAAPAAPPSPAQGSRA